MTPPALYVLDDFVNMIRRLCGVVKSLVWFMLIKVLGYLIDNYLYVAQGSKNSGVIKSYISVASLC